MIYRIVCAFLGWYMRILHPKITVQGTENLPTDRPYVLICDCPQAIEGALLLATFLPSTVRFVKPFTKSMGLIKKNILRAFHIEPLMPIETKSGRKQPTDQIWKDAREHITDNHPLVFFSTHTHKDFYISKAAVKLGLHTETVFDFTLNLEIVPVKISMVSQSRKVLSILPPLSASLYENEYKQFPARTIKKITQSLHETLSSISPASTAREQYMPQQVISQS